jgi:lysophospholipase L1-like esterase
MTMIDCMILGDSIAKGISDVRKECVAYATSGINSYSWNNKYNNKDFISKTVIISLGTNDGESINSFNELLALRQSVQAGKVFWIMPAIKPNIQDYIKIIANNFGDIVLPIPKLSPDRVHPTATAYRDLAQETK